MTIFDDTADSNINFLCSIIGIDFIKTV